MSTGLERLIEASKDNIENLEPNVNRRQSPDNLEDALQLLIERDNPMADAAEKTLDRL